jgi:hypothetical protein
MHSMIGATNFAPVANPYFSRLEGGPAAATYHSDAATGGPWAAHLQHGGPPAALLVAVAEQLATEHGRTDLAARRLAAEFVGPVPVGDVSVDASIARSARTAVLVDATLSAHGRVCVHARIWLVRRADTTAIAPPVPDPDSPPTHLPGLDGSFPYADSIEWRLVRGSLRRPGPGVVWARPDRHILDALPMSSLQRACLIGDSASGISAELDWTRWSFLNVDLDVHLARSIVGDWVQLDAVTQLGADGSAVARSTVSDLAGPVGATLQTLVVEPRQP